MVAVASQCCCCQKKKGEGGKAEERGREESALGKASVSWLTGKYYKILMYISKLKLVFQAPILQVTRNLLKYIDSTL